MKNYHLILFVLTIALGACRNTAAMSSTDQIISGIYTAGTLTLETQTQVPTFTSTSLTIFTATPSPTPMLILPTVTLPANEPNQSPEPVFWQNSNSSTEVDHSLCDKSAYIEDITIPDGTVLAPGEIFIKSWMLKNTGFCMWKDSYKLKFFGGDSMSGLETEIGKTVASGNQTKVSIELTAPNAEGTYTGYWILANKYDYPFGTPFFVQIVVKN